MKPETRTKFVVLAVLVILAVIFRWEVLGEGVLGNTFSSLLGTFPFFEQVITSYGTIHRYFTNIDAITYNGFLDSTMKTLIMIMVQSPVNRLFNAVFTPERSGRSMYPGALSDSEQIDVEEEYVASSWYKTRGIYAKLLASLVVTLFVSALTSHLSDAFAEISNVFLSGLIETLLVILMLVACILLLRDSSQLGLGFSISYRILGVALKYGARCFSNIFLLRIALEILSQEFKTDFLTGIVAVAMNVVGWMVLVMLEDVSTTFIRKKLIALFSNRPVLSKQDKQ